MKKYRRKFTPGGLTKAGPSAIMTTAGKTEASVAGEQSARDIRLGYDEYSIKQKGGRMKKLVFLFVIMLFTGFIFAGKVATLPKLVNPASIAMDNNQCYIVEGAAVSIYSLKDFSLIKKFGRVGDGPGEFKTMPALNRGHVSISVDPDYILVNSIGKVSLFNKDGTLKEEFKTMSMAGWYLHFNNQFAGGVLTQEEMKNFVSLNMYDPELKVQKTVYKVKIAEIAKGINPVTTPRPPQIYAFAGRLFIDGDDDNIHVFDKDGKEQALIKLNYEKIAVSEDDRNRYLNWYKTDVITKQYFEAIKKMLKFPQYFPAVRAYNVADNKVYVLSYKKKDKKSEMYIYDLKGTYLSRVLLPLAEWDDILCYPYTIKDGTLYQLIENEDETWELHKHKI